MLSNPSPEPSVGKTPPPPPPYSFSAGKSACDESRIVFGILFNTVEAARAVPRTGVRASRCDRPYRTHQRAVPEWRIPSAAAVGVHALWGASRRIRSFLRITSRLTLLLVMRKRQ